MSLFTRNGFAAYCASLPAVTLTDQWEASVAKVGGKVFALRGDRTGELVFKVPELSFEGLTTIAGIGQAAYFAKGQWVRVERAAEIGQKDLKAYIAQSHRIIAGKLTRKLRAELGLLEPPAGR